MRSWAWRGFFFEGAEGGSAWFCVGTFSDVANCMHKMQFFTDFATVCEHAKVLLLPAEHVPTKKREMYKYLTTLITNTRWNEFVDGWLGTWRFRRIISLSKWMFSLYSCKVMELKWVNCREANTAMTFQPVYGVVAITRTDTALSWVVCGLQKVHNFELFVVYGSLFLPTLYFLSCSTFNSFTRVIKLYCFNLVGG